VEAISKTEKAPSAEGALCLTAHAEDHDDDAEQHQSCHDPANDANRTLFHPIAPLYA
jgi:hypothetical protein